MQDAPISRVFDCYNPADSWFAKHKGKILDMLELPCVVRFRVYDYGSGVVAEFPTVLHHIELVETATSETHTRIFVAFNPNVYDGKLRNNKMSKLFFEDENLNHLRLDGNLTGIFLELVAIGHI